MNNEELIKAMNAAWIAAKSEQGGLMRLIGHPPYRGDWRRFWCKLVGHKWQFHYTEHWMVLAFGEICARCGETTGGTAPQSIGGIDRCAYDWWRNGTDSAS